MVPHPQLKAVPDHLAPRAAASALLLLGVYLALVGTSEAQENGVSISATSSCVGPIGQATVSWILTNATQEPLAITAAEVTGDPYSPGMYQPLSPNPVPPGASASGASGIPGQQVVTLTLTVTYDQNGQPGTASYTFTHPGGCRVIGSIVSSTTTLSSSTSATRSVSASTASAVLPAFTG